MSSSPVKFGTSGVRGLATSLTAEVCFAYTTAFLAHLGSIGLGRRTLCLGGDKRPSSAAIAAACGAAARAAGVDIDYAGLVPTPALARYAAERDLPALMVTGSHNPEDQNGLKFYRPDGELGKSDEAPIAEQAELILGRTSAALHPLILPVANDDVAHSYRDRFLKYFDEGCLGGLKLGVDLHSAAGGDLTLEILGQLGAECVVTRRSERFIAVDTEAVDIDYLRLAKGWIDSFGLHAVVSTDGDGDRPLVIDETGTQIGGDVLGALAAHELGFSRVATPVSASSAIERSGWFEAVRRTRIGSPYVIAEMHALHAAQPLVAGFEANGGFLTLGDLPGRRGPLPGLTTRDAMLPIIAVLATIAKAKTSVSELARTLPQRVMLSGRVPHFPAGLARELVADLIDDAERRSDFLPILASATKIDATDGARVTLEDGVIVHYRASGNAPELRCYVEADERGTAALVLADALAAAEALLAPGFRS